MAVPLQIRCTTSLWTPQTSPHKSILESTTEEKQKLYNTTSTLSDSVRPRALRLGVQLRPAGCSEHQVLELGVDEGEHDGAGPVQDGAALDQGPGLGEPRL